MQKEGRVRTQACHRTCVCPSTDHLKAQLKNSRHSNHSQSGERRKKQKSAKKTSTKKDKDKFLSSVPDLAFDIQYRFKIFVVGDTAKPIIIAACSSQECPVVFGSEMSEPDPTGSATKATLFGPSMSMMSASSMSQASLDSRFESEFSTDEQEAYRRSEGSSSPDRSPCPSEHRLSEEAIAKRLSEESYSPPDGFRSPCLSEQSANGKYSSSPCGTPRLPSKCWHSENLAVPVLAPSASSKTPVQNRCICSVPYPLQPPTPPKFAKLIFNPLSFNSSVPRCRSAQDASSTAMVFCITVDPAPSAPSLDAQLHALLEVLQERRRKKKKYRPAWAVLLCHSGKENSDELEPWSFEIDEFEREHGALWRFGPTTCQNGGELYSVFAKIASQRIHASEHLETASNDSPEQSDSGESENSADESKPTWGAEFDELTSSPSLSSFGPQMEYG